jgi:hypothetical protein
MAHTGWGLIEFALYPGAYTQAELMLAMRVALALGRGALVLTVPPAGRG